jgi:Tfp pilus assembly protein PilV
MKFSLSKFNSGFTLLEALMAIAIFTMGMAGFSLLFVRTWQNNSYALEMGQSSLQVSQGINTMEGYIRGARQGDDGSYPIKSAADNDLVIYSDYDSDDITERLHFYYSSGTIYMGITDPTSGLPKTYPTGDQQTQIIATHIVNNASTPVFYYYNTNYPGDTTNNPMTTPASISDVRLVKIMLHININPNRPPDNIQMQTFVEMRNLNDYDRAE